MKYIIFIITGLICFTFEISAQTSTFSNPFQEQGRQSSKHDLENYTFTAEMEGGSGITTAYRGKTATSTPEFIAPLPEISKKISGSNKTATSAPIFLDTSSTGNSGKTTTKSPAFPDPLPNGCAFTQTNQSVPFPTAAFDLDGFFIVQGKALWLPEKPTNPNGTIAGIDIDSDCVRDDIEHYIARKYSAKNQYRLRKYLYEYTAWMDAFLIGNISESAARYASNQMAEAGICIRRIVGENKIDEIVNDLFAKFHNTNARTLRYFDNLPQIAGWTTREPISISCP